MIYDTVGHLVHCVSASLLLKLLSSLNCDPVRASCQGKVVCYDTINFNDVISDIWDLWTSRPVHLCYHHTEAPCQPCNHQSLCIFVLSLLFSLHDFQLSNILSVHFACTYLSLQGIHFRHLVVWSPLAPMSLPVTRFFVTAKGRTQGLCGNRSNPNASLSPLKTLSLLGPPDCSAPSPFWQLQQRRKPGGKVAGGAADSTYHHQLTTGDWFSVRFVQKIK